jgi:outer membrane protein insertion porin family
LWDNRFELRMPIAEQLLWWVFFFDGVVATPEIGDLKGMGLDDFRFSVGGGVRFTIPQFPIRLYLAKRFQYDDIEGWRWLDGDLPFFGTTVEFVISLGGDTFF